MSSEYISWNKNQPGLLHTATSCGAIEQDVQAMLPLDVLVIAEGKDQIAASLSFRRTPDWRLSLASAAMVHACLLISLLVAPYLVPSQQPSWPEVVPVSLYTAGELEPEAPPVQPTGLRATPPRPAPVARRARNNTPAVKAAMPLSHSVTDEVSGSPATSSLPPAPVQQEGASTLPVSIEGAERVGAAAATGSDAMEVPARPRYRENRPPPYPEQARRRWLEGTVVLEALVGGGGKVDDLAVHASSGHQLLDEAALHAVRLWLFEPGRRGGLPVTMKVLVPVRFALR